ncbi:MAG TPA: ABC transporter permease [Thermodesulfobacteriota bacterium]|nr:ABC transporter permease [Thermodesulfobacteriota bacterium]
MIKGMNSLFNTTGGIINLFIESLYWSKDFMANRDKIYFQIINIGNNTIPVAALISLFIGGVLALQTGPQLAQFGVEESIGGIVGLSMVKELGPVMAAILIAGRIGSAMTAEISSMTVYEEVDALKTMDINPVKYLVMPRLLAVIIAMPILVVFMDLVGWFGGAVVSAVNQDINVSYPIYFKNLKELVDFVAILNGMIKSVIFGILIISICGYVGLSTRGGPREIGTSVTRAVVLSFITVLISDYFITRFLFLIGLD